MTIYLPDAPPGPELSAKLIEAQARVFREILSREKGRPMKTRVVKIDREKATRLDATLSEWQREANRRQERLVRALNVLARRAFGDPAAEQALDMVVELSGPSVREAIVRLTAVGEKPATFARLSARGTAVSVHLPDGVRMEREE